MSIDIYSRANQVAFAVGAVTTGLIGGYLSYRKCQNLNLKVNEQVQEVKDLGYDALLKKATVKK